VPHFHRRPGRPGAAAIRRPGTDEWRLPAYLDREPEPKEAIMLVREAVGAPIAPMLVSTGVNAPVDAAPLMTAARARHVPVTVLHVSEPATPTCMKRAL
jgi:hypothetical protein